MSITVQCSNLSHSFLPATRISSLKELKTKVEIARDAVLRTRGTREESPTSWVQIAQDDGEDAFYQYLLDMAVIQLKYYEGYKHRYPDDPIGPESVQVSTDFGPCLLMDQMIRSILTVGWRKKISATLQAEREEKYDLACKAFANSFANAKERPNSEHSSCDECNNDNGASNEDGNHSGFFAKK